MTRFPWVLLLGRAYALTDVTKTNVLIRIRKWCSHIRYWGYPTYLYNDKHFKQRGQLRSYSGYWHTEQPKVVIEIIDLKATVPLGATSRSNEQGSLFSKSIDNDIDLVVSRVICSDIIDIGQ